MLIFLRHLVSIVYYEDFDSLPDTRSATEVHTIVMIGLQPTSEAWWPIAGKT